MYNNRWKPISTEEKAEHVRALTGVMGKLRAKAHISQTMLGEIIGASRQYVSAVERGDITLSWSRCLSMAFFFGNCEDTADEIREIFPDKLFNKVERDAGKR